MSILTGVARRRKMDFRGMEVTIRTAGGAGSREASLDAAEEGRVRKRPIQKSIKLYGHFSQKELQILRNSAKYCPVGQIFSGQSLEMEEEFQVEEPVS